MEKFQDLKMDISSFNLFQVNLSGFRPEVYIGDAHLRI